MVLGANRRKETIPGSPTHGRADLNEDMRTVKSKKLAILALFPLLLFHAAASAQPNRPPIGKKDTPPPKLNPAQKQAQAALNAYTDAANFQNRGAFPLAIEAWQKLLKNFPKDPLASKAKHYLGICYLQLEKPDYEKASVYLRQALEDKGLEVREEALVKLGVALYESGIQATGDSQKKKLSEANRVFQTFLEDFADGSFADQAIFYAADCEQQLGEASKASKLYRRLVDQATFKNSEFRPNAMFALGSIYLEQKQEKLATETFEKLLQEYPKHRLVADTQLRLADVYLQTDRPAEAEKLLGVLAADKKSELRDYVLYRQGYALAKLGRYEESSKVYQQLNQEYPKSKHASGASLSAGQTLMRDKKYREATVFFRQLLPQRDNNAAEAAHLLCQCLTLDGDYEEAASVAREALKWSSKSPRFVALKMDLAEALNSTKDGTEEARKVYEQIALEHAKDSIAPRATYNAAFAAMQMGDLADAQRWGEIFAKNFPKDQLAPDVAYVAADSTLQLGQFAQAATAFEQLIKSQPQHPSKEFWELRLGRALLLGNDLDRAVSRMMELADKTKSPDTKAEAYFLVGASLLKQNKTTEAVDALKLGSAASSSWGSADESQWVLAQALLRDGKSSDAIETLKSLPAKFPKSRWAGQADLRIGQIMASSGEFKNALVSYQKILESEREQPLKDVASYGKAWILMQQEDYADSLKILDRLSQNESVQPSTRCEAAFAKAICLRNMQRPKDSVEILEKLRQDPQSPIPPAKILYELGLSYAESKNSKQASDVFDKLIQEFPQLDDMDKVLYEYAWSLKEQNLVSKATQAFAKLSSTYPQSPLAAESLYYLGQQAFEQKNFDQAIQEYSKVVAQTKDEELLEKALYKLGLSYFQQDDYARAATQFEKLASTFPNRLLTIEAHYLRGECATKQEQFEAAMQAYQAARQASEQIPKSPEISQSVRELIYLHGAQAARELKKWKVVDEWLDAFAKQFPESEVRAVADYEQAYSLQAQNKNADALKLFTSVAEEHRNEIGARSRFMIGELYFAQKDFAKAILEFEKLMYGYGAEKAPADVKNWQARAAFEAGRCTEVLVGNLQGQKRTAAIQNAEKYYRFLVEEHPTHELQPQAKTRLLELAKLN
jgi:cellulose synthase operon protein C